MKENQEVDHQIIVTPGGQDKVRNILLGQLKASVASRNKTLNRLISYKIEQVCDILEGSRTDFLKWESKTDLGVELSFVDFII